MPAFNLKCPKGYGEITFVQREKEHPKGAKEVVCPVSSTKDCVDCDVISMFKLGDDKQAKREKGGE